MSTHTQPSAISRWAGAFLGGVALMALGGWVADREQDAAETVVLGDLRADLAELKQNVTEGNAQLERNSAGRALANREEYLRIVSQIERRLDRLEDSKR